MSDDTRMKLAVQIAELCFDYYQGKAASLNDLHLAIAEVLPKMPSKMEIEAAEILAYNGEIETGFIGGVLWLAKELGLGGGA